MKKYTTHTYIHTYIRKHIHTYTGMLFYLKKLASQVRASDVCEAASEGHEEVEEVVQNVYGKLHA